jgi:hypothetical protein
MDRKTPLSDCKRSAFPQFLLARRADATACKRAGVYHRLNVICATELPREARRRNLFSLDVSRCDVIPHGLTNTPFVGNIASVLGIWGSGE